LKAHSQFIKRVSCSQCGAPKSLPSTTASIHPPGLSTVVSQKKGIR
jgi:hypothetical protein